MADLFIYISIISSLLPFLASMFLIEAFEKRRDLALLCLLFCLSAVSDVVLEVLFHMKIRSAWISHVYTLMEFLLVLNILLQWQKGRMTRYIRCAMPFYILIYLGLIVFGIEKLEPGTFNYISRPLALTIMIILVFHTLYALGNDVRKNLVMDSRFWFLIAMAIYFSSSTILFAFTYTKKQGLLFGIMYMHGFMNILHNILFTIGVFHVRRAQQAALQPTSAP